MNGAGLYILLVEDNSDHAELIIRELKKGAGLVREIRLIRDGRCALDYLFGEDDYIDSADKIMPDVILLDLKLPKVDGLEVLKRIRASADYRHVPVIVLTTSSHEEDVIKSYTVGTNLYITKPVKYDQFIEALKGLDLLPKGGPDEKQFA